MRSRYRYLMGVVLSVVLLIVMAWIAWFPSPQESGYRFLQAWGASGAGPGEFHEPIGIAIAGDEIFVSDSGNHRIQVFDREGRFLRQFGQEGSGAGELARPMHLDIQGDRLYVAEYLNDRIQVFTLDGASIGLIGESGTGPGQFDAPGGVAVDATGQLYVADFYNQRVQALNPDGAFIRQYGKTGEKGLLSGQFNYPTDVALLSTGNLAVADAYNDRIQIIDPTGTVLRKWGGPWGTNIPGSFNGWFKTATAVAVDSERNVFVADFYNHRIQKFASDGTFLVAFGEHGAGEGQFDRPTDMAVGPDGRVYVVDFGNDRIEAFPQQAAGSSWSCSSAARYLQYRVSTLLRREIVGSPLANPRSKLRGLRSLCCSRSSI